MVYERPNPDDVLKAISKEHKKNGKLKIFFGYAAGVGKTFAMLEAAHKSKESGIDVVAGYIEPHTRVETLNLLNGLEMLPNLKVDYKGISLNEFNIDGALERKPDLILVDELAHSNAVGCRHVKRYQDIKELLDNGIDVYTTVNVQHIESLNDIVASITGIIVKERIPDSVFDNADQIELVDIEPRRTADAVNKKIDIERERTKNSYYTEEHLLICLSSSPSNAKVIRTAARMADAFHGLFTALFVETTDTKEFQDENRVRLERNLKLAEQLGARIATVYGDDIAWQISEYAKLSGVSKIVLGRSTTKKGLFKTKKTLVDKLTEIAPNIDIYIIPDNSKQKQTKIKLKANLYKFDMVDIAKTFGILFLSTILALIFFEFGYSEANIITIYIFGVLLTSITTSGKRCGILMSILAVLTFNFLFTDPRFTFQAYDKSYPVTFAVMFISSIVTSKLATKVKLEAQQSTRKAYRTEVLLETSQKLQIAKSKEDIFNKTAYQTKKLLDKTIILYKSEKGVLAEPLVFKHENDKDVLEYISEEEKAVAQWTLKNKKHAGATTNTLPGAKCLYLSIRNHEKAFGVIGIPLEKDEFLEAFEKNLLIAVLGESALALEKEEINQSKNKIYIKAEQEKLRSNLLRSISHDLRTPLTSISGNAGILINNSEILSEEKKKSLYLDIYDDSMWLINLVENLLSITRIENGTMKINTEPELVEEVIEEAICHINRKVSEHKINTVIEDDLLMAKMDSGLIIQVIINIINNAIKYTPKDSIITITSKRKNNMAVIEISDNGKGINEESKEKLFDMFFTDNNKFGDGRRGLGLGLALCKSIIDAHEGCIYVRDNKPNGAIFGFTLHIEEVKINE